MLQSNSKTPNFDARLDAIFMDFEPREIICKQCQASFKIEAADIELCSKLRVPPPTKCFLCLLQQKMGYRINLVPVFYKKRCSAPGHTEKVISFYSDTNAALVYDDDFYYSDAWDGTQFGGLLDPLQPFFSQWHALAEKAPRQTLQKDRKSVNCDYVVSGMASKNCYFCAVPLYSEDQSYATEAYYSKNCVDVMGSDYSENCYYGVYIDHCHNCKFAYESMNCLDCSFIFDCRNCTHCFGCTNLRNKQYCFFNEQLTKQEYEEHIKGIDLGKREVLREYQDKFEDLLKSAIYRGTQNVRSAGSVGDLMKGCNNCYTVFRQVGSGENLRYVASLNNCKDMMHIFGTGSSSDIYNSTGVADSSRIKFSLMIRTGLEVEYSMECTDCEYCFGCFGLRNKKYCIFNKQYEPNAYWERVDEIKTAMLDRGEYGEFFPLSMSPFPYSDTAAWLEFPLTKEEVVQNGWRWEDEPPSDLDLSKLKLLQPAEIPNDISKVKDDILNSVFICEKTKKPFRITKSELDFYKQYNLALPTIHPEERMRERIRSHKHPYRLWQYPCSKCGMTMDTIYELGSKEMVYCEACYQAEVA